MHTIHENRSKEEQSWCAPPALLAPTKSPVVLLLHFALAIHFIVVHSQCSFCRRSSCHCFWAIEGEEGNRCWRSKFVVEKK